MASACTSFRRDTIRAARISTSGTSSERAPVRGASRSVCPSPSELLPRADRDGRLYFGSDRAGSFGKGDIYVATQSIDGKWTVGNVGPPVSTSADEYEAEISQDGRTLIAVVDRGDRSHLYRFERVDARWVERDRIPAYPNVFQVGPLLSPAADRLLFAQADGVRSGELFVLDLMQPDLRWPACSIFGEGA
jgi:hypothetical protein